MRDIPLLGFAARSILSAIAVVAVIWLSLGRIVAEKVATALAMPTGIIWWLMLCLTLTAIAGKRRGIRISVLPVLLTFLGFTLAGNGFVAGLLSKSLERPYFEVTPLSENHFDAVIVLGGGATEGVNHRMQGNGSGDRLILAAQMHHAKIADMLICTGRRITELDTGTTDPAEKSAAILQSLGVPPSSIEMLGGRNTAEEMNSLAERFANSDARVGLLTSAWHLPRALRLARRNGFQPLPVPADFMTGPIDHPWTTGGIVLSLIPQADALNSSTKIAKEYLAMFVNR